MEYTPEQIGGALVAIGIVLKGALNYFSEKKGSACEFTEARWDKLELHFERINMKLDNRTASQFKRNLHSIGDRPVIRQHILTPMGSNRHRRLFTDEPSNDIHIMNSPIPHL